MKELYEEFKTLKAELFGNNMFIVQDDSDLRWKRYSQLLGYFYPCYRTKDWITPKTLKQNENRYYKSST